MHLDLCRVALLQVGELLRFSVSHHLSLVRDNENVTLFLGLERERPRRRVHRLNFSMKDKKFVVCNAYCVRGSAEGQTENAKQQNNGKSSHWPWDG